LQEHIERCERAREGGSFDRAAIKARAETATEGPWWTGMHDGFSYTVEGPNTDSHPVAQRLIRSDAEFIAHAREDIPALLAALEEAERQRDDLEARLAALLCDLTDGRMSGTGYNVQTMVSEVEAAFDRAQQAEVQVYANAAVEAERLLAERTRSFEDAVKVANAEKAKHLEAERRIAAVEEILAPEWIHGRVLPAYLGAEQVARLRAIECALHPVAETTESEKNDE